MQTISFAEGSEQYLKDCTDALCRSILGEKYFSSTESAEIAILEGIRQENLYVAFIGEECVGFTYIIPKGAFHSFPYLHIIAVKEEYRNRGIGKSLLNYSENIAYEMADKLFLVVADYNPAAKRFVVGNMLFRKAETREAETIGFGMLGLLQWIRRKSIAKVDRDILLLGGYYILVILGYLIFEMIPINYRPILIDGVMEASYPSSTTLLVLSVMPTMLFQINRRAKSQTIWRIIAAFVILFSTFMVIGRLVAGVHWLTDIVGSVLLSAGLYCLYRTAAAAMDHS